MDNIEQIKNRRSIRRFKQDPLDTDKLIEFIDCARLAPSGGNIQPLEYVIVHDKEQCARIFSCLKWVAYIKPDGDPPEGYRPAAYIVVLVNTGIRESRYEYDVGASVENILIAAETHSIGSCWIRNFKPEEVGSVLELPEGVIPNTVIALGYPAEESVVEPFKDDIKYWKDEGGTFHVPKRPLGSILHIDQYQQ